MIDFCKSISWRSYFSDKALPPGSDFWLRDENGEIVRSSAGSPHLNVLKPEVQDLIVKAYRSRGTVRTLRWRYAGPVC